jgi:hypothetical protein
MKPLQEECVKFEALLDDYVDGALPTVMAQRVESHLRTCPDCGTEVEDLRRLLAATAELPRGLEPGHDLWPGIVGQLQPRTIVPGPRLGGRQGWWIQAVAALFLMVIGAFLGRLVPIANSTPVGNLLSTEVSLASWESSEASSGFGLAEVEFLRAKENLWLLALRHQNELSPVTRKVVERNLRILDKAIDELRTALENDPGNPELESLLLNHHRRGVDLLERLARTEV